MNSKHFKLIATKLNISERQVENTVNLLIGGATIPFISRYRKEVTGTLDEMQVADIKELSDKLSDLEKRRESILDTIEKQGQLTDDLKAKIEATYDNAELEDLYLPYKQKKKTRAVKAKEKGLEPLAKLIFMQNINDTESEALKYLNDDIETVEDALQGVESGMTLMLGGFGLCGIPENSISQLVKLGITNLTCISNNAGVDDFVCPAKLLIFLNTDCQI